jgi:hypothetical protein
MRLLNVFLWGAVLSVSVPAPALRADLLWYNGDFDGRNSLQNRFPTQFSTNTGQVFDDFTVPAGQQWFISSVFSNNLMSAGWGFPSGSTTFVPALFDISTGVSAGNAGTSVTSGSSTGATLTPTGRSGFGLTEYTVEIAQLSPLNIKLNPGTYWLSVAPYEDSNGPLYSFMSSTSGANAVGKPPGNDGNSFWNSSEFGANFKSPSDPSVLGAGTWDFSEGIRGTVISISNVPEPSPILPCLAVAGGLALTLRRRFFKRAERQY